MKIHLLIATVVLLGQTAPAEQKYYSATNLWKADVGHYNQSSPAMDTNGGIYVTTWDGRLLAINPDGTRRWVFRIGFESVSSPAVGHDGSIYFGSRNRRFYAVSSGGDQKWVFQTGGWVDASAAIGADGTTYIGSWDKKFYALSPDGLKQWEFVTGGPVVSSAALSPTGIIYFGSHDRKFYALNPDGSKRWEFATGGPITSSPAIGGDGEIYFSSVDGRLYALNADGTRRWELRTGGITGSSPVIGADGTIFISVNQTHCAISPEGKLKWQRDFWHAQPGYFGETGATVLTDGTVTFTGGDGYVMTVPGDDGAKEWIWNFWLYGPSYSAPLVTPQGAIYVMSTSGHLQLLQREVPPANSSWPMFRANPQRNGRVAGGN